MLYLILLVLGLLVGAGFLVVLLIGDRREARLEAQKRALREQVAAARRPVEGAWPPPPTAEALPPPQPALPAGQSRAPGANRNMVRTFFRVRNYAAGTALMAYTIYSCFPRLSFVWVLLGTALAAVLLAAVSAKLKQSRQRTGRP